MTLIQKILSVLAIAALAACADTQAVSAKSAQGHNHGSEYVTVKPGAAVSLTHSAPKAMQPGMFQTVTLTLSESYDAGTLRLDIVPSDGLRLFGGAESQALDLANGSEHSVEVDVQADADGVYFLNVFAKTDIGDRDAEVRSFSVRLDIGTVTSKMLNDALPENGEMSADGKIRVLEGSETIR